MKNLFPIYLLMIIGVLSIFVGYYRFVTIGFSINVVASIFAGIMFILLGFFFKSKLNL